MSLPRCRWVMVHGTESVVRVGLFEEGKGQGSTESHPTVNDDTLVRRFSALLGLCTEVRHFKSQLRGFRVPARGIAFGGISVRIMQTMQSDVDEGGAFVG